MSETTIAIFVNPLAGTGKYRVMETEISRFLIREKIVFVVYDTIWPAKLNEFTHLFIVGGDGTLNYFLNTYPDTKIPISLFKAGSGNDFAWKLNGRSSLSQQLNTGLNGVPQAVDAGICNGRLFINGVGIGFDGAVVKNLIAARRWLSGNLAYYWTVLKTISAYMSHDLKISFHEKGEGHLEEKIELQSQLQTADESEAKTAGESLAKTADQSEARSAGQIQAKSAHQTEAITLRQSEAKTTALKDDVDQRQSHAATAGNIQQRTPERSKNGEGRRLHMKSFMITVANGSRFGGNFMVSPHSSITDKQLDLVIIEAVNVLQRYFYLPRMKKGRHLSLPFVKTYKLQSITIESNKPVAAHLDGELMVASKFDIQVLPGHFVFRH